MSYFFKLYSHPKILLKNHLENVAQANREKIRRKNLKFSISKSILEEVAFLIGLCHDVGKATSYFQRYILSIEAGKKPDLDQDKKSHGLLSALFGYIFVDTYIQQQSISNELMQYLPSLAFIVIRRHHGDLEDVFEEFNYTKQRIEGEKKLIQDQLNEIDYDEVAEIFKIYTSYSLQNVHTQILRVLDHIWEQEDQFYDYQERKSYELFILTKLLFSTLIASDKYDAIFHQQENNRAVQIQTDLVDQYKLLNNFTGDNLVNKIRQEVYKDVLDSVDNINADNRIMSITLPTGMGKTLTSFSFALNLRDKLTYKGNYKIIYSLPFTSIIDQNFGVLEDIFKKTHGNVLNSELLLKHHYLADLSYKVVGNEFKIDQSRFMIESWQSQIIVTTFIQFFHTLFSNRNISLIKYHNMANSIVLLDEIQSIPYKYWEVINSMLKVMAEYLDMYFILITATQPLIFDRNNGEIKELAKGSTGYFQKFNRTKMYVNIDEVLHIEDFLNEINDLIEEKTDKDLLIVMNTIKSSLQVYEFIEKLELKGTELYYLSTNIVPKDRKKRINAIKKNLFNRKIIVSTQLIEAGVDIDVDIVVRDFAPLDSINQVAGRCNRNGKKQQGDVYIFRLRDDKKELNQYVYDDFLIAKTAQVLEKYSCIEEKDFLNIMNEYFTLVKAHKTTKQSKELLEGIYKLQHKKVKDEFKLIEQDYEKIDVFIELDEKAKSIWNQFQKIRLIKNPIDRKNRFLEFKKDFYDYVISVHKNKFLKNVEGWHGYISYEEITGVYDIKTGYRNIDETVIF